MPEGSAAPADESASRLAAAPRYSSRIKLADGPAGGTVRRQARMRAMLGWHITVYRFGDSTLRLHRGNLDATLTLLTTATGRSEVPKATDADRRLAVWQAALGGTDWLRGLVESRRAAFTSRGGYPDTYLIRCEDFRARLEAGLPDERTTWISEPHDVLDPERWMGRTTIDGEQLEDCAPDEWLLAVVWDES